MNRRILNGTYGGVRRQELATPLYSIAETRQCLVNKSFRPQSLLAEIEDADGARSAMTGDDAASLGNNDLIAGQGFGQFRLQILSVFLA